MTPRHDHLDAVAILLLLLVCASWGLQQTAIKLANAGISPVLQGGLRSLGAALLVWAWAAWRGQKMFAPDGSLRIGLVIGALFTAEFAVLYLGFFYTSASRGVLFLYTTPFVVAVGAHLFIPGERLTRLHVIGLLCAFAGIALAFEEGLRLPTGREILGDGLELLAALFWGATTVVIRATEFQRYPPAKVLFYQLACSAIVLPLMSLALGEPGITHLTPLVIASFAYQTIFVGVFGFLVWFWLVARYPASKLASFSFVTPLVGVLAGGLILHEPITRMIALAMLLVALGIYLVNRPTPRRVLD